MKFYDFIDKQPAIGRVVIVEGTEPIFADRAIAAIVDRALDPTERDLNLDRFVGTELESLEPVSSACAAMPFLGSGRLVIVRRAEAMRAPARAALWDVAQGVPDGNTLVIEDLDTGARRGRRTTFGEMAGRAALRVDASDTPDARVRFVRETLTELGISAEPSAIGALAGGGAPLIAVRTDLEKLALLGSRLTLDDVVRESVVAADAKGYQAASALVEGDARRALALTQDLIVAHGDRGAAVPILGAIASEYRLVWELTRSGGELPARFRWRERALRPIARRLGERRARRAYERAVRSFEALVTGRADDLRTTVAMLAAVATNDGREGQAARATRNR